jgi:hypothetical protein
LGFAAGDWHIFNPSGAAEGDSPIFAASCRENRDSPREPLRIARWVIW